MSMRVFTVLPFLHMNDMNLPFYKSKKKLVVLIIFILLLNLYLAINFTKLPPNSFIDGFTMFGIASGGTLFILYGSKFAGVAGIYIAQLLYCLALTFLLIKNNKSISLRYLMIVTVLMVTGLISTFVMFGSLS